MATRESDFLQRLLTAYAGFTRHRIARWCLLAMLPLFASLPASAAPPIDWSRFESAWFTTIGVAQGLRDPVTTAVEQDAKGLIWIGTTSGLVRWDGHRSQPVLGSDGNDGGLRDTYVRALLSLPDGTLLIGTNSGGLARFEPATGNVHVYRVNPAAGIDGKVYGLAPDHHGGAWLAMDQGLFHFDVTTDALQRVAADGVASKRAYSVLEDRAGNLWLGNDAGLFMRAAGTTAFVHVTAPGSDAAAVVADKPWALAEDARQRIWVGGVQAGAAWRTPDGVWHAVPGFSASGSATRFSTVRAFRAAGDSMWIATDGSGILVVDLDNGRQRWIRHDPGRQSSLPGDVVRDLLVDRDGGVWAATDLGVGYNDARRRTALVLLPGATPGRGLADGNVRGIFTDSRGRVWIGYSAGKIDVLDDRQGTIHHLRLTGSQVHRDVLSFAEGPDGTIWVGALGLVRIDPDTLQIRESVLPALVNMPVLALLSVGDQLLLATYDGAYRYTPATGALQHIAHDATVPDSLADNTVRGIVPVNGELWYLTSRGISVARDADQTAHFQTLRSSSGNAEELPQDTVNAAVTDTRGRIWVATLSGIGMWDRRASPAHPRWRTFTTRDGLPSNRVDAVLDDAEGNIWVSTSLGIARVDGRTLTITQLGPADGARLAGTYTRPAAARTADGTLLFGSVGGITVIDPRAIPTTVPTTPLLVTRAVIDGRELTYGHLPVADSTVHLDDTRSLRVGFALLDYHAIDATTYAYRLVGFDDTWNSILPGNLPGAIYTNLPHGKYRLELRATTTGLIPNIVLTTIDVEVAPRGYQTWPAKLAALLALALLVTLVVHLRTAYLRRRAADLQDQIDRHTADLTAANARLNQLAHTDELTGAMNRRRFMTLAQELCEKPSATAAAIALFDLDHFKLINDRHGHLAGDATLRFAVATMRKQCRSQDYLGRFGGEEFVLCLPGADAEAAAGVCERIRAELAAHALEFEGVTIAVTTSVGVARRNPGETLNAWLARADQALYAAKATGRNRVVVAPT